MKILLENWRQYLDEAPKAMAAIPGTDTQSGRQGSIDYFWDEGRENLEDEKDPKSTQNQPLPRFCTYGITIREISCGEEHTAFVTDLNYLYTVGSNRSG